MFKKTDFFFVTFEKIVDNLKESTHYFLKITEPIDDLAEFAKVMKDYEHKGDEYTHAIIKALNKTFITPIEREDILSLATTLDDVLDGIEACASRFEMYQIRESDKFFVQFGDILNDSILEIGKAINLLSSKKLLDIRKHAVKINELENQADDLLRLSTTNLFANVTDPIHLIKKKDIYELLEITTDHCEDVANILESIIMRNS